MQTTCISIRKLLRELSVKTGVPIEPEKSTLLLDKLLDLSYVYYAAIPGAGGDDAILLICEKGSR